MKNIIALIVMVLCSSCVVQNETWLSPSCAELSTDDRGTVFFVRLSNPTTESISFESADIDMALKFGVYKLATSGLLLSVDYLDDDVMYEVYSEQCNLLPMSSLDYKTEIPMRINGVLAGEDIELSIDCDIEVLSNGVREARRLRCNMIAKILPRDAILRKILCM